MSSRVRAAMQQEAGKQVKQGLPEKAAGGVKKEKTKMYSGRNCGKGKMSY